jgi:hypothetical protein
MTENTRDSSFRASEAGIAIECVETDIHLSSDGFGL